MAKRPRLVVDNTRPRKKLPTSGVAALVLAAAFAGGAGMQHFGLSERLAIDTQTVSALPRNPGLSTAARAMPLCRGSARFNCVVDGDTVWINGEKIRILNLDAPEVNATCDKERQLAADATRHLIDILSGQPMGIVRNGTDRYGRTLARIVTPDGDVGQLLMQTGTAARWSPGHARDWCR